MPNTERSRRVRPTIVCDTGVFLQAALRPEGPAGRLLSLLDVGRVRVVLSDEGLRELIDVLHQPSIRAKNPRLTDAQVAAMLQRLRTLCDLQPDAHLEFRYKRDPDDEPILNLAIASGASFLVSRDNDLLDLADDPDFAARYPRLTILDPVAFLRLVAE